MHYAYWLIGWLAVAVIVGLFWGCFVRAGRGGHVRMP
jgi:hypothetical protein